MSTPDAAKKPKARAPFSSGFPDLDAVYRKVSELIHTSPWSRPFSYEFLPDNGGTHCLVIGQQYRFLRRADSVVINVQVKESQQWRDLPRERQTDRFQGYGQETIGLLSSVSPIFWPVAAASPRRSLTYIRDLVPTLWLMETNALRQEHPELFVMRDVKKKISGKYTPTGKPTVVDYKVASHSDRARTVLTMRISRALARRSNGNYRFAIKCWWEHFVDPDLFKVLVSVTGGSKATLVDFASYAAFTQTPELDNIIEQVQGMGRERRMLALEPFSTWTPDTLRKKLAYWQDSEIDRILKLPSPILLTLSANLVSDVGDSMMEHIDQSRRSRLVDLFEHIAQTKGLRDRQRGMAAHICLQLLEWTCPTSTITAFPDEGNIHERPIVRACNEAFDRKDLPVLLVDLVHIWRNAFPEGYALYSAADQSAWLHEGVLALLGAAPGRIDFSPSALDKVSSQVDNIFVPGEERRKLLEASAAKHAMEKLVPRRGRGRPRKDALPALTASGQAVASRPRM